MTDDPGFAAGFDFARDLRNPAIRSQLRGHGFDAISGDVAVLWTVDDEEAVAGAVGARRVLLVSRDDAEATGWAMRWAETTR